MGKMLCVDYFPEGNLNITAVYLYIYVFPGIRDAGKDFIGQCGNIIFTVGLYKIVPSPDLESLSCMVGRSCCKDQQTVSV